MNAFLEAIAWIFSPDRLTGTLPLPTAIVQHLWLTGLSVLIAAVIAIPFGWLIGHTGRGREIAVFLSGAARALPSLGLVILLYLVIGVNFKTEAAIVAFVILAIPSILAGAYAGVEAIDRDVIAAGRAMGMTEWQILWKIEVPLGLPLLIGGLRSATLQVVATVTIAAYVGIGGLGFYIIQGIQVRIFPQILGPPFSSSCSPWRSTASSPCCSASSSRAASPCAALHVARRPCARAQPRMRPPDSTKPEVVMSTAKTRLTAALAAVAATSLALAGCASSDPLTGGDGGGESGSDSSVIVIGSQAYPSNELIAEIYAQALEADGFEVERNFTIGQRDAYMPSIEDGTIDLFPEYTGNLLQYFEPDTTATTTDDVYAALQEALPENLTVLDQSSATDQDSYNVTRTFAEENDLTSIADLAGIEGLVLGGAPELELRPYGPEGLKEVYDVDVTFNPTADSTIEELVAGNIQLANVYTADPLISANDLVTLEDPEGLFLASHVVPLVNVDVADEIADTINAVSAAMTPEGLIELNVQYTVEQRSLGDVASEWLEANGLA